MMKGKFQGEAEMQQCNCRAIREEAKKGDYGFLLEQLDMCEACAYNKKVSKTQEETYETVRLHYVAAYWEQHRSESAF